MNFPEAIIRREYGRALRGMILVLLVALAALQCKKSEFKSLLVVTFPGSESTLSRGGKVTPLATGMFLRSGDILETRNSNVDMQSNLGFSLRLRSFSRLKITNLHEMGVAGHPALHLEAGSLMGRLFREGPAVGLDVSTPTALASVRGTTFIVEVQEEGLRPRVKVLEGRVNMTPRVAALEAYESAEIEAAPALKTLREKITGQTRLIEAGMTATLDASAETELQTIEESLEKVRLDPDMKAAKIVLPEMKEVSAEKRSVVIETGLITPREEAEKQTLLELDESVLMQGREDDPERVRKIDTEYDKKNKEILLKIEEEARAKNLVSEKELLAHYRLLEIVTLNSGEVLSGAIKAQTGTTIIMHTTTGVRRLDKSEINFVRYRAQ